MSSKKRGRPVATRVLAESGVPATGGNSDPAAAAAAAGCTVVDNRGVTIPADSPATAVTDEILPLFALLSDVLVRDVHAIVFEYYFERRWVCNGARLDGVRKPMGDALYFRVPPLPIGVVVTDLSFDMKWKDQGWGNQKGQVWLRLFRQTNATEAGAAATAAGATAAPVPIPLASSAGATSAVGDSKTSNTGTAVPAPARKQIAEWRPAGIAPHQWETTSTLISARPTADGKLAAAPPLETVATTAAAAAPETGAAASAPNAAAAPVAAPEPAPAADAIVSYARGGDEYVMYHHVGGGGGHQLYVSGLQLTITFRLDTTAVGYAKHAPTGDAGVGGARVGV